MKHRECYIDESLGRMVHVFPPGVRVRECYCGMMEVPEPSVTSSWTKNKRRIKEPDHDSVAERPRIAVDGDEAVSRRTRGVGDISPRVAPDWLD